MPELLAAVYFAVSDLLPARASFRTRGRAQRQCRGPETLLITAGATMRPFSHPRRPSARRVISSRGTHFGDSRVIASPRRNKPLSACLTVEAAVSDAAWAWA